VKRIFLLLGILLFLEVVSAGAQIKSIFEFVKNATAIEIKNAIDNGADVNARSADIDDEFASPLVIAIKDNPNLEAINVLLKSGASVNEGWGVSGTPLMVAAKNNAKIELIDTLLEAGADVNRIDYVSGMTPLMFAAKWASNPDVIIAFLKAGADATNDDKSIMTALDYAQKNKNLVGTEALSRLEKASSPTHAKIKFLQLVKQGTLNEIQAAIKQGADLNYTDTNGMNSLMYAAGWNQDPEVIRLLLNSSVGMKADKNALLMYAAANNPNPAVITTLLKAGANIGDLRKNRQNPLINAAFHNTPEVIAALIKAGAEINISDTSGGTPLDCAVASPNPNPVVITMLLKAGADINARGFNGMTPLMSAVQFSKNLDVITELLQAGANIEARDNDGQTALMYAAESNKNDKVILALIQAGGDVNAYDKQGRTPLLLASYFPQSPDVFNVLLKAGAKVDIPNDGYMTPLMGAARRNKNPEVINILLKAGVSIDAQAGNGMNAPMLAAEESQYPEVITALLKAGFDQKARSNEGKTFLDYLQCNSELVITDFKQFVETWNLSNTSSIVDSGHNNTKYEYKDVLLGIFGKQTIRTNRLTGEAEVLGAKDTWYNIKMNDTGFTILEGTELIAH
jgi:uncharacterized protein